MHADRITSAKLQSLLGVRKVALNDLAKRGIVQRGERKGTYALLGPRYGCRMTIVKNVLDQKGHDVHFIHPMPLCSTLSK